MVPLLLSLVLGAASVPPPVPEPPRLLERERQRSVRASLRVGGERYPVSDDAAFTLDGKPSSWEAFWRSVKTITAVRIERGWVVEVEGTSVEK